MQKKKELFESIELNVFTIVKNYLIITQKIIDNKWIKRNYKKDNDSYDIIFILALRALYWYSYNPTNK